MKDAPTDQDIFDHPYSYQFFQAVRVLEKIFPDKKRVGREALPHEEVIRFRSRVTLDFPSSEVHEIRDRPDENGIGPAHEMLVNFMGMVGPSGVLPSHYSELVLDRIRYQDTAMWSFLDIFTHRSVSMFFRAWAKYRFPIGFERGDDDFTDFLFDFCGLGTKDLRGRMHLEDEALLPYAGLIAQKPHSTNAVENIIEDHFGVKARLDQFHGQWLTLEKRDVTAIGLRSNILGDSAIVGNRIWDQQSKFRVKLGPMKFTNYLAFIPVGSAHRSLRSIVRFMVGFEFDFDVQLVLEKKQIPGTILTTRALRRPMLGWTSFLKTMPAKEDDEQLVLGPYQH